MGMGSTPWPRRGRGCPAGVPVPLSPCEHPEAGVEVNVRDWDTHRRLAAEGRLNLLFRLSEPLASRLMNVRPPTVHSNVILFISRSDQLFWRNRWTQGRFVKLAWTAEQRAEILRQDEIFRQADVEWERRHPKTTNAAMIVRFPRTGRGSAC